MGFISRHITPLVINSLGGGHTHTSTHTHTYIRLHRNNFKNQARAGHRPAHTWLKNYDNGDIRVVPSPRDL